MKIHTHLLICMQFKKARSHTVLLKNDFFFYKINFSIYIKKYQNYIHSISILHYHH